MCFEGMLDPDVKAERRRERQRNLKRAQYAADPERFKARVKAWAKKNPEQVKASRKASREKWKAKYPERHKACVRKSNARPETKRLRAKYRLRVLYKLTPEAYDAMVVACCGRCEICGCDPGPRGRGVSLSVDHDHATGAVRGMLCHRCNAALGMVNDSVERLDALKEYILKHRRQANG